MLDAGTEREALAIVEAALDATPAAQEALIAERCGGRAELVQRVRELLAADASAAGPTVQGTMLARGRVELPLPLPPPPAQVGAWALEELIGSGGMGAVYRARRADGLFEQAVAVKFVRPGPGRAPRLQLMDAERRLLARMSHPSIARILDAGSTTDGVPYLVMELVDGLALDRFVADRQLGWRERVQLMRQVCAAVAHAHGLLVLHNDIKPPNVLVNADGLPKLIDFGVARLQGVADDALPQGFTPGYASPQRLAGEAPTVADEVFSLGVMLRGLLQALPADAELAAIVARATAPQREDRYPTVAALDDDLQRRLDQRPVLAMHGGSAYRARKLLQRRPWRVAAAAAAVSGLLAALVVTGALYLRAEEARREAQTRFNQTRDMARFMIFELDDQLEAVTGTTPARRAVVARGQLYIDALAATASDDRSLQREVAVALRRLAEVQGVPGRANLGERAAALANVKRAEALLVSLQPATADWTWQRDLGHVRYVHSLFTGDSGADYPRQLALAQQAEQLLVAAITGAEAAGAAAQQLGELHTTLLGARLSQGFALRFLDRHADAGRIQAAEEQRIDALPPAIRAAIDHDYHRGRAPTSLGDSLYYQGQIDAALAAYQRGANAFEAGLAQRPANRKLLEGLQIALWNIAGTLGELKRHPQELEVISRAMPISERLLGLDPKNRQAAHMMMVISDHLANALSNNGRHAEALRIAEANRRQRDLNTEASPDDGAVARSSIVNLWPLSSMYRAAGDRTGECKVIAEALRRWERYERRWGLAPADLKSDVEPLRARAKAAGCAAP